MALKIVLSAVVGEYPVRTVKACVDAASLAVILEMPSIASNLEESVCKRIDEGENKHYFYFVHIAEKHSLRALRAAAIKKIVKISRTLSGPQWWMSDVVHEASKISSAAWMDIFKCLNNI